MGEKKSKKYQLCPFQQLHYIQHSKPGNERETSALTGKEKKAEMDSNSETDRNEPTGERELRQVLIINSGHNPHEKVPRGESRCVSRRRQIWFPSTYFLSSLHLLKTST